MSLTIDEQDIDEFLTRSARDGGWNAHKFFEELLVRSRANAARRDALERAIDEDFAGEHQG